MSTGAEQFLFDYLNTAAPTGFESKGQKVWMDYLRPYADEFITDTYGTAVAVANPGQDYKVVLEAHADEISWFVHHITSEGFIYVKRNGGSDPLNAPGKRVRIFGDKGEIRGIFGWPAIHVRKEGKEETPKVTNIFVDIGATSDKEVREMGVRPGTVMIYEDELTTLNSRFLAGRALDNRIGGYMIAQVLRRLRENKVNLPFTLYVVNAVQEEVGLRGAQMIAERLTPDVAIITDVTHDTQSPMMDKLELGDIRMGGGPVLAVAPAVHNKVLDRLAATAGKHSIPFQYEAISRSTGTDTDSFAYSNMGVASALVSLPLRYMHTTTEMVQREDVEACIALMYNFVAELEKGTKFSYFH